MSCLALSLQIANGSDILLHTREWFPLACALGALSAFCQTRCALASNKNSQAFDDDAYAAESIGDDLLTASSGQVIVGVESRYRVRISGVSNIRLAAMLASLHSESIAKMVHSAIDSENKIGGADTWTTAEVHSIEHQASIDAFSKSRFELPPETLAAGDEVAATLASVASEQQPKPKEAPAENDPFAASDAINKPQELVGGFKKTKHGKRNERTRESRAVRRCQTQLIKQA